MYCKHWSKREEWQDLKEVILKTANEVLGKRPKRKCKKGLKILTEEIQKLLTIKSCISSIYKQNHI
jgi:hypothetical protein